MDLRNGAAIAMTRATETPNATRSRPCRNSRFLRLLLAPASKPQLRQRKSGLGSGHLQAPHLNRCTLLTPDPQRTSASEPTDLLRTPNQGESELLRCPRSRKVKRRFLSSPRGHEFVP